MPKSKKSSSGKYLISTGLLLIGLALGGLVLSACGVYEGYPTAAPVTATPVEGAATPTSTAIPVPTFPPLPTSTPRPALPSAPANVKLTKDKVLQQAYVSLLNNYYQPLSSADTFEVALIGIRDALKAAGVSQPDVPIPAFSGNAQQDFQLFLQAFIITFDRYKANLSEDKMAYAALQHSTETLGECATPLTNFYPPDQAVDYVRTRDGTNKYVGLGINVLTFDATSGIFITRVIPGTPADKAGLKLGDAIVGVGGQDITKLDSTQAARLLQGTANTRVSVTVRRAGSGKQETVDLTRAEVQAPSIEQRLLPDNIAYLRFNVFPNDASVVSQFDKLLADYASKGVKGYILDLRGTRWGYIGLVQSIASRFISGQDLVYLLSRNQQGQNEIIPMSSVANVKPVDKPVAVLVDQNTSNEAEIFALAFKNKKKGSVFGTPTAGCPVASSPTALPDNSLLNLATYRSVDDSSDPSSWTEQVAPDVQVSVDAQTLSQGQDAPLDKAIAFIKSS